jgi:acyl dehydratase
MRGNLQPAEYRFTWDDQWAFARASGDFNPMHVDPVAARRTQAGVPVVHGIHLLMRLLDYVAREFDGADRVRVLTVRFLKFVEVGEVATFTIHHVEGDNVHAGVAVDGVEVAAVALALGSDRVAAMPLESTPPTPSGPTTPLAPAFTEAVQGKGSLDLAPGAAEFAALAPAACKMYGLARIAALAGLSRLVGMISPGLHSIFGGLRIEFTTEGTNQHKVVYRVASSNEKHRAISHQIDGGGISGKVQSFMRLAPASQLSFREVKAFVAPGEFSGSSAVVIGASRGLGELTAKIIAAGGGSVLATYAVGREDCENVACEIREGGGNCRVTQFDALASAELDWGAPSPRTLYYFATRQIARRKPSGFSTDVFSQFIAAYVSSFERISRQFAAVAAPDGTVFYPSTVFVGDPPPHLLEYAMAKQCGEMLCSQFGTLFPGLRVSVQRLPKLLTDQTNVLADMHQNLPSAFEVLLPIIRGVEAPKP